MYAIIEPVSIFPSVADKIYCRNVKVNILRKNAQICWDLISSTSGESLKNDYFTIQDEEYNNWADDDSYILNLIANKLGLKIIEIQS